MHCVHCNTVVISVGLLITITCLRIILHASMCTLASEVSRTSDLKTDFPVMVVVVGLLILK